MDFIDFCKYMPILNLMAATHFKQVGTEERPQINLGLMSMLCITVA